MSELKWKKVRRSCYSICNNKHSVFTEYTLHLNEEMYLLKVVDESFKFVEYYIDWGKSGYYSQTSDEEPVRDFLFKTYDLKKDDAKIRQLLMNHAAEMLAASSSLYKLANEKEL